MRISARYLDGRSSTPSTVDLMFDQAGQLAFEPALRPPIAISELRAPSRIARVPIELILPDGATIEVANTEQHVAFLAQGGIATGVVGDFEANTRLLLGAIAAIGALIVALMVWGIPTASKFLTKRLPADLLATAEIDSLAQLDRFIFKPTALSSAERATLSQRFERLLPRGEKKYRLEFRRGGGLGANALALPGCAIVITDELVGIAADATEIDAVLLHEIGHLDHRHSLQMLLSHTGLATLAALVFGDVQAVATLVVALPSVLMESSYSRKFETEADDYALAGMRKHRVPPSAFATMLEKLEQCAEVVPTKERDFVSLCRERLASKKNSPAVVETEVALHGYFSTHPATADRIERFKRLPD